MTTRATLRLGIATGLLLWALPLKAQVRVQIREIGLNGYYNARHSEPTRVAVQLTNLSPSSASVKLQLRQVSLKPAERQTGYTAHQAVSLAGGEQRSLDMPVLLEQVSNPVVIVEAYGADGTLLGEARRELKDPFTGEHLVALVCNVDAVCDRVQSSILFSGSTPEKTEKGKSLKFTVVREVPAAGWLLGLAGAVVVAAPELSLNQAQQGALEWYLRNGGRVVLLEDEIQGAGSAAAKALLAAYREPHPDGRAQHVGRGDLRDLASAEGPELGAVFTTTDETGRVSISCGCERTAFMEPVRSNLGTVFQFPGLAWLLAWVGVYVLVIGIVNFSVLHRLGRREWAWLTMPALSVLFAGSLYGAGQLKLPDRYQLDDLSVIWMDGRSGLAGVERSVEAFSPRRGDISLTVSGDVVLAESSGAGRELSDVPFSVQPARLHRVHLDQERFDLSLEQWASLRLGFAGIRNSPGTIVLEGSGRLKNETGQAFRGSVYVADSQAYILGSVAPGAEADWGAATKVPVNVLIGSGRQISEGADSSSGQPLSEESSRNRGPFSKGVRMLGELLQSHPSWYAGRSSVFLGWSEEAPWDSSIADQPFARRAYSVTIVFFERKP